MSEEVLGRLCLNVAVDAEGGVNVNHTTDLSPALNLMQSAMGEAEKHHAVALRRAACEAAGRFFAFVRNPDGQFEPERSDSRLDELDRSEWLDVVRMVRPDWSEEQFDAAWGEFVALKRRRNMQ